MNDTVKWQAWEAQKKVYAKAGGLWDVPLEERVVEFVHGTGVEREKGGIPVYVRVPLAQQKKGVDGEGGKKSPVVVLMTGLDGYRPDNTVRCDEFLGRGW